MDPFTTLIEDERDLTARVLQRVSDAVPDRNDEAEVGPDDDAPSLPGFTLRDGWLHLTDEEFEVSIDPGCLYPKAEYSGPDRCNTVEGSTIEMAASSPSTT